MATKIAPHFTLEELTKTSVKATNTPNIQQTANLCCLAHYILEPLRLYMDEPIVINSGFRSAAVNRAVGGVANSRHLDGCAADIRITSELHGAKMFAFLKQLAYIDELLYERSKTATWLHVAFSWNPRKKINAYYKV